LPSFIYYASWSKCAFWNFESAEKNSWAGMQKIEILGL